MMLPSSRGRLLDRPYHTRDARLIVVATEGTCTEKQYFAMFRNSRVKVHVIGTPQTNNRSAPEYVLDRLREFKSQYTLAAPDELWLAVDTDRWGEAKLKRVCREAEQLGSRLAVSNPCFELWLLLHVTDAPHQQARCTDIVATLRETLGSYSKSNLDTAPFRDRVEGAIERAQQLDTEERARWPRKTGTRVYRLVRSIMRAS